jgi:hypothetical protein
MLEASDLEVNVLEFRQRAFSFERLATVADHGIAVFGRTETESESQFRPKLLHLKLAVPQAWVVYDEPNDVLRIARDGSTIPVRLTEPVVEVAAEPPEFQEQGIGWRRAPGPGGTLVYAPTELADELLAPKGFAGLGLA